MNKALRKAQRESKNSQIDQDDRVAKDIPWQPRKAAITCKYALAIELQKLYWDGVRRELVQMILTLQGWQKLQITETEEESEKSTVDGVENFVDQVSESSRDFAAKYAQERMERIKGGKAAFKGSYVEASAAVFTAYRRKHQDLQLKTEIKGMIPSRRMESVVERRARMILQGAAFLDIDKVIMYNPPLPGANFWRRSAPPQLTLSRFAKSSMPDLKPMRCKTCGDMIRGVLFKCLQKDCEAAARLGIQDSICETCFRDSRHPVGHMTKFYKHYILKEIVTAQISRKICVCNPSLGVPEGMSQSGPRFPLDRTFPHRGKGKTRVLKCGLLLLSDKVMEAKYQGTISNIEKGKRRMQKDSQPEQIKSTAGSRSTTKLATRRRGVKSRKTLTGKKDTDPQHQAEEKTLSDAEDEKLAEKEIPLLYRKFTKRYPFGNVHMALMFGPLMIENGVPDSKKGVRLSTRDPLCFGALYDSEESRLEMALGSKRSLYRRTLSRQPRRVKAFLKQIVGDPFQALTQSEVERGIIRSLVAASENYKDDPRRTTAARQKDLKKEVDILEISLKKLLDSRVEYIIDQISERLLDPSTKLTWSRTTNNCQNFCDRMLPWQKVGGFLGPTRLNSATLNGLPYLVSFVTRPGSYHREKVVSKFDVPNGLTEEYLLKFRLGRHDDSDLVDTLQEYWYDWGAFGGTLYKYQHLFPWDCTVAYDPASGICNTCSLSKHVWSFPFDSHGIVRLHLTRQKALYPPETEGARALSNEQWMRNRLTVLLAQDTLLGGTSAMYQSALLRSATEWLHSSPHERVDRVKLGGIHRAQPYSHEFEKGRYHEYMLADWALYHKDQQIERYEYLRNRRVLLPDVVLGQARLEGDGGGDWDMGGGTEGGGFSGSSDTLGDVGSVGWMGTEQGDAQCLDNGIVDGWDGDYPDGYEDDPGEGAEGGYGDTGGDYGGDYSGDYGGDFGGDGGGGDGGGGDGGGGD